MKEALSMMDAEVKSAEKMPAAEVEKLTAALRREDRPEERPGPNRKGPEEVLSDIELRAFVPEPHAAVEKKIDPKLTALAQQAYETIRRQYSSPTAVANSATGWMLMRAPEGALWLMGKACMEDPNRTTSTTTLAFLVMAGAKRRPCRS